MKLFILKRNAGYGCYHGATGLHNSAKFVVDMLNDAGVEAALVEAIDNNSIDRLVSEYRPDTVVIEALWVVPDKFDVLKNLHPGVHWIVRLHSDIPFLAGEGVAVEWIKGYIARGIEVAFNSPRASADFNALYLPNFYPLGKPYKKQPTDMLRIGCFGAIRPMKNQLIQAIAAIELANQKGKTLEFWINGARCEDGGNNVRKNIRSLFANTEYKLVEIPWLSHDDFLYAVSLMDIAMCVSMSETFCITAADAVSVGTPLVCSGEVPWASGLSVAPTTDVDGIVRKMNKMLSPVKYLAGFCNRLNLMSYSECSRDIWLRHFGA
jgi:hypothetical protein